MQLYWQFVDFDKSDKNISSFILTQGYIHINDFDFDFYFKHILFSSNYTDNGSDTSYKLKRSSS